jgi:hypothetical protein
MRRLTCPKALTLLLRQHGSQISSLPHLPVKTKVVTMLLLSFSLTPLLILLGLLLPQISASLDGMSSPDNGIPDAQALEHPVQSPTEPPLNPGVAVKEDPQTGAQLEPRGVQSATCDVYPLLHGYKMVIDFQNWDPARDGKPDSFKDALGRKFGKDNINNFWWKKFPTNTRFMFDLPYSVGDPLKHEKYTRASEAIFEYSGKARIRTTCYPF